MKSLKLVSVLFLALAMLALLCASSEAAEPQVYKLTYACGFPPNHPISQAIQSWEKKIEKETNGRVTFQNYWSGSLISVANSVNELVTGTATNGLMLAAIPSGIDIANAME